MPGSGLRRSLHYYRAINASCFDDEGGGEALSSETGAPLLGVLSIDIDLRKGGDIGIPLMVESPDSPTGCIFREIAEKIARLSSTLNQNHT